MKRKGSVFLNSICPVAVELATQLGLENATVVQTIVYQLTTPDMEDETNPLWVISDADLRDRFFPFLTSERLKECIKFLTDQKLLKTMELKNGKTAYALGEDA